MFRFEEYIRSEGLLNKKIHDKIVTTQPYTRLRPTTTHKYPNWVFKYPGTTTAQGTQVSPQTITS